MEVQTGARSRRDTPCLKLGILPSTKKDPLSGVKREAS